MNYHGSIHSPDACNFYKALNAPERVVSIAADGLKLPFDKKLPTFWYKNNASARNDLSFVRGKVNEWCKEGFVEKVKFRPRHISPLTVSTRVIHTGEVKKRLCFDATFVNSFMVKENTKLPSLKMSEALVQPGDYGITLDLKNCYFHVRLHKEDYGKISFALPSETNQDEHEFFVVLVMIYGLLPASFIVNSMTKPLMDLISQLGIKSTIYIDDIRITNECPEAIRNDITTVKQIFNAAGWIFANEKESTISQNFIYLGFYFDTLKMRYSVPSQKVKQLESLVNSLDHYIPVEIKFVARIVGKMICLEIATSMLPRLHVWQYFHWIGKIIKNDDDWNKKLKVSKTLITGIRSAFLSIVKYSGQIRLKDYHYEYFHIKDIPYYPNAKDLLIAGDGNKLYGAWYNVREKYKYEIIEFTTTQVAMSSSYRELIVLHTCIKNRKTEFKNKNVVFFTDSRVLFFWYKYGSTLKQVAEKLIEIHTWLLDNHAVVEIVWKPRSDSLVKLADTSSRSDSDEYSLPKSRFNQIEEILNVRMKHDLFASSISHQKLESFYSRFPTLGSSGCDALKFDWARFVSYCFPPKNLSYKVFQKIESSPVLNVVWVLMKTKHDTIFKLLKLDKLTFKPYVKKCLMFCSRVYSPSLCTKFTTEMHTWYVLHIIKGGKKYNCRTEHIIHL